MEYEEWSPRVNAVAAAVQLVTYVSLLCRHRSLQLAFEDSFMKVRYSFQDGILVCTGGATMA